MHQKGTERKLKIMKRLQLGLSLCNFFKDMPTYNCYNYSLALLQSAAIYAEYLAKGPIVLLSICRWLPTGFQSTRKKETHNRCLHLFNFYFFFFLMKQSVFPMALQIFVKTFPIHFLQSQALKICRMPHWNGSYHHLKQKKNGETRKSNRANSWEF